jgi:hypothetical protein
MSSSRPRHETVLRPFLFAGFLSLLIFTALSSGCTTNRNLLITEIGKDKVELYLDEPAANLLALNDHRLIVTASDNTHTELDLSVFGRSLKGGEFMMVWEDGGYGGDPIPENYPSGLAGVVPGIKVAPSFFNNMGNKDAAEVRVQGRHSRGSVIDKTDDCVRFGDMAKRPQTGGSFVEDASPPLSMPRGSLPLERKWDTRTGRPSDTDHESDWTVLYGGTWGVKTN